MESDIQLSAESNLGLTGHITESLKWNYNMEKIIVLEDIRSFFLLDRLLTSQQFSIMSHLSLFFLSFNRRRDLRTYLHLKNLHFQKRISLGKENYIESYLYPILNQIIYSTSSLSGSSLTFGFMSLVCFKKFRSSTHLHLYSLLQFQLTSLKANPLWLAFLCNFSLSILLFLFPPSNIIKESIL